MPPPSSAQQKVLTAQFVSLTGATERQATKFLKSTGYKISEAVDAFYYSNEVKAPPPIESKLDAQFDTLRDDKNDEKDKMELESTMEYLSSKLKISIENAELLVALEVLQAPSVGEITRRGYVDGWKVAGAGTTHQEHSLHIRRLSSMLSTNHSVFKKVYKYTFVAGREGDQKALSLENALIYWGMLFSTPGMVWKSENHDWLDLWKTFLNERWTRSINKDMWNMTLEFAVKSVADESLSFWNEDGAWPSVIDDFVGWCHGKGIGRQGAMDVDAE
ncbi:defective in cullin neddylation protein 1 [Metarhizium rileyi]|uniref:Defective in cullin neddylation protein n=1 Tax=Metarhizium rileyi (strain RCEF 4871) TaxID=1649241 RepID=A0A167CAY4_METRR|nr:defective in cullin neddylation protein 1 [Metarhizium rileyi RCEF 4871]TWU70870.1 Scaffold-type E3 ligase [Metarhizium rileyi]